jgi:2,5-dioxopentanoate dehydrogenase
MNYNDTPAAEINIVLENAWAAFHEYRKLPLTKRAELLRAIAAGLEAAGDALIETTMRETNLPEARCLAERGRTMFQLNQYAAACEAGTWLEACIDTAVPEKTPPKPDIRKMLVPLGPVALFGASNFPYAYGTAGGDTACALAAGCPVIVKAHPAHPETSALIAAVIENAVAATGLPKGVFAHVYGAGFETGKQLVMHPLVKAVGFTGSYNGGKQLFDWANERPEPIPVFAEMGSINPVFLLPQKLDQSAGEIATQYAASINMGVGQFCTNPGLIIGIESEGLQQFTHDLGKAIQQINPSPMLHAGIAKAYSEKKEAALIQEGVHLVAEADNDAAGIEAQPAVATASAAVFLSNPLLQHEVFGPYSLVIHCKNMAEMQQVAAHLGGQLTATLMATEEEAQQHDALIETIKNCCGRIIMNGVPTGVEVCLSMHHGGPFPATTDSRFTSVGADGIKRFARPLCFQNWPNVLLPAELQNENTLDIWRTVNNELTKSVLTVPV